MSKIAGPWEYYRDTWHDEDTVMHVRSPQDPVATVYTGLEDARKIAAVNELLEALEAVERFFWSKGSLLYPGETVHAALAKAHGVATDAKL